MLKLVSVLPVKTMPKGPSNMPGLVSGKYVEKRNDATFHISVP